MLGNEREMEFYGSVHAWLGLLVEFEVSEMTQERQEPRAYGNGENMGL